MYAQLLLPLFVATILWGIVFGAICYYVAEEKGRDGATWLAIGAVGGLIALLVLASVPAVPRGSATRADSNYCPSCAAPIGASDRFCRQCGVAVVA